MATSDQTERAPARAAPTAGGLGAATRFEAPAAGYEHSALQPVLYEPVQHRVLELARRLVRQPRRIVDVGCGTGRLLRQARRQHPAAVLVGVDIAWAMVATASAATLPS